MRLLLIEDDKKLCESLSSLLSQENFETDVCLNGSDGLAYIKETGYDLILLDRMLPGTDGLSILHAARRQGITTPVIFLTAMGELGDRVCGLDSGADDYIVKPFAFDELMAHIRCVLRRSQMAYTDERTTAGDLVLTFATHTLSGPSGSCELSAKEVLLLTFFMQHSGQTLNRRQIIINIWGIDSDIEDGNLDNYVYFLRRRLSQVQSSCSIKTVRGVGYRFMTEGTD